MKSFIKPSELNNSDVRHQRIDSVIDKLNFMAIVVENHPVRVCVNSALDNVPILTYAEFESLRKQANIDGWSARMYEEYGSVTYELVPLEK